MTMSRRLNTFVFAISFALCAAFSVSMLSAPAHAQPLEQAPLPLNRYTPVFAGDLFFAVASPTTVGHPGIYGALFVDYANDPLVLRDRDTDEDEVGPIVGHQLYLHLNATFALWQRVAINLSAPIAVFQDGDNPAIGGTTFTSPSSAQFGDLRIGLRGRIWSEPEGIVEVGVGGYLWVPTGSGDVGSFVGNGSVRGLPQVLVGGRYDVLRYGVNLGVDIREKQQYADVTQGSAFSWGLAGGIMAGPNDAPEAVLVSAELLASNDLQDSAKNNTNVELLLGGQWFLGQMWPDLKGLTVGVAAGPGLAAGAGTPDFRTLAKIAYGRDLSEKDETDRDGDGIFDHEDACPDVPGVANDDPQKHGCPPPTDRDGDKIFDHEDACPDVPGVANVDPKKHGCPPPSDRDGDKIFDAEDACPDVPGVANADPKKHGCPPPGDRDKDTFVDPEDACPDTPGVANADPKKHGCPTVQLTNKQIIINERIEFDFNRSTIRPKSNSIIDQVAKVLRDHPEIVKVEIQGHTDNVGTEEFNQGLSERRAKAVRAALSQRGIALDRMVTKGFGFKVPREDADTDEARQRNRRVEFHILKKEDPTQPGAGSGSGQPGAG